jgi:hypothetical protein
MSFWVMPMVAAKIAVNAPNQRDNQHHCLRMLKDNVRARQHVKTRRHHSRRMN